MTGMTVNVTKPDGSREALSDETLDELNAQLRGQLVTSTDPEADEEPTEPWNAMYPDRAALTARCSGTADVVDAVNFARERGLLVAVRSGGHSVAGLSTVGDGMLIDLSAMRGVQVDPERRLARVQGGADEVDDGNDREQPQQELRRKLTGEDTSSTDARQKCSLGKNPRRTMEQSTLFAADPKSMRVSCN